MSLATDTSRRVVSSVCPLDCPDTCLLQVTFEDDKLVKLAGDPEHPNTRGFACVKMARYPERQEHKDRLEVPLRRTGPKGAGQFAPISWDQALDTIAARLGENIDRHGEQSVLPYSYAGTMGLIERDHPLAFFRALGASELDWTICSATGGAAWKANYGPVSMSMAPEEIPHSRLVILWGINAVRSNSHLMPWLKEARRNGAKIVHIDPYRNETSRIADLHLQVRVGTDAALALAIGGEILRRDLHDQDYLDEHATDLTDYRAACAKWPISRAAEYCGLDESVIRGLALEIGNQRATFIKAGYGMTRNEGGGNALRAITLLPALTGAWKHIGGGGALSTSGAFGLNMQRYSGMHLVKPRRRHINQNQLGRALNMTEDPISTLFVFNSNPAAIAPDSNAVLKGLQREDLFTVVLEHFQTDTADFADILLPATTFLEHADMYTAYGHYYLQWSDPAVPARGQCRPNSRIFHDLAERLGLDDEILRMSAEELATELLDRDHFRQQGIDFERLRRERSIRIELPGGERPYVNGSRFSDRKIRFSPAPEQVDFQEQTSVEFPLRLISPPGQYVLNTSMGNIDSLLRAAGGEPTVIVHPQDAADVGIVDGQRIEVTSPRGSIRRKAIVSTDACHGSVIAIGQWWPKLAPDKRSLNALTSQELTDLGGGSLFGNSVVRIAPAS